MKKINVFCSILFLLSIFSLNKENENLRNYSIMQCDSLIKEDSNIEMSKKNEISNYSTIFLNKN